MYRKDQHALVTRVAYRLNLIKVTLSAFKIEKTACLTT